MISSILFQGDDVSCVTLVVSELETVCCSGRKTFVARQALAAPAEKEG